jgi:hypothetical protein
MRAILGPTLVWSLAVLVLLLYEADRLATGQPPLTDAMRAWSGRLLILPAAWGCLGGHFYGRSSLPPWAAWLLVPAGLVVLARDILIRSELPAVDHLTVFFLFAALGAWLWGAR